MSVPYRSLPRFSSHLKYQATNLLLARRCLERMGALTKRKVQQP